MGKTFKIEAIVKTPPRGTPWTTEEMIADMLRYDAMHILNKYPKGDTVVYTLQGNVRYTPARWISFGIKTKEIE